MNLYVLYKIFTLNQIVQNTFVDLYIRKYTGNCPCIINNKLLLLKLNYDRLYGKIEVGFASALLI